MSKKKPKGVLQRIGDAVATGAEAVIDAGAKAIHTVGEMMPAAKTPPKRAKASPKARAAEKLRELAPSHRRVQMMQVDKFRRRAFIVSVNTAAQNAVLSSNVRRTGSDASIWAAKGGRTMRMQQLKADSGETSGAPQRLGRFAAIDFETADNGRDSACALAIVVVDGLEVVERFYSLIRPPRPYFLFTYIHGITWRDVADQPGFGEVWTRASSLLEGVEFVAAHSASFDRSVLYHCCSAAGALVPPHRFQCTVKLARRAWGLNPAKLPDVCRHLKIELQHHQAESDAAACAQIVIASRRQGHPLAPFLGRFSGSLPTFGATQQAVSRA
jgi:DNA polymerase III subunit epsilon